MNADRLNIAMFSIHSSPIGKLGTKDTGGMSVYIRELARKLGCEGHRVDIYSQPTDGDHRPLIDLDDNVRLIQLGVQPSRHISKQTLYPYLSDFFRLLENFRNCENLAYDIIHSHYWLSGLLGNWARKLWNRPHVIMFHTLGAVKNGTGVGIREPGRRLAVERQIVKACHRILAPTEREGQRLVTYYQAPSEKIGIVPCGVNLDLFRPIDKLSARKTVGLDPDDRIILYVGRFEPLKGLDRLLEAMAFLKSRSRLRLLIIGGDGNESAEFRQLHQSAVEFGIADRVVFAGRIEQEHLPPYYAAADALIIPSHYESFGLVGLEALACGRPVISTPVGAMENLIRQGQTGRLVKDNSARSLAAGIESIFSGPPLPAADVIRESVLEYSWSRVAAAILAEYDIVLRRPPAANESIAALGAS